jgi:hypothetical protein
VYDILGRHVQKLVDSEQDANQYKIQFDANSLASGVYFYRLRIDGFTVKIQKMLLVR